MTAIASAALAASAFAFNDEPDELNWDLLGGTLTGFRHLRGTCAADADFARRLLDESAVEKLPEKLETVWITPDAFTNAVINQWGYNVVQGEKCLSAGGGHLVGLVRIPVEIPADGCYRVWTRYWHEQGSAGSFAVSLEDGSLAENPDASLSVVQDAWSWRFDFVEFARRQNPLPDYRQEPTGFRWEASPTVRLKKGRRTLSLCGLVHDGPYGGRNVAAVVLTREPLAVPEMPAGEGAIRVGCAAPSKEASEARAIWERRPQIAEDTSDLKPLWREWRERFFADLVAGKIEGVEAGRMAGTVYFDDESNLVGTPRQVADEKAAMKKFLAEVDRTHFKLRLEAEAFTPGKEGWWTEASSGASGGKILVTGWWGGECDAFTEGSVPTNGNYSVWIRYMEIAGYLAKYSFLVEDAEGKTVAEKILAADDAYNRSHGGLTWVKLDVPLAAGKFRVRVRKTDGGLTYRRVDEVIVTDDPAYVPEGEGIALQPLDDSKPLTVWRQNDPWLGFSRVSAPLAGEGLAPYGTEIREGESESILVLVRNNTDAVRDATPRVSQGWNDIVKWRVVGFVQSGWAGWQPMPLFERDELLVPPGETAGVWLTVTGRRRFWERTIKVEIGDETLELDVKCKDAHGADVPVPYVFGWAAPYRTVSCWELFRDIGVNVINDVLVSKAEAEKYGVRLTVHLNDGDVSEGHVKYLNERFAKMGYEKKDWAWSFMDEPGNSTADIWTNLATQVRALDPDVKIWVNPGEFENAGPEACMKITPFANIYCPYCNHYQTNGGHNPAYNEQLLRKGPKFDILLGYTTPCFGEKAPSAPLDLLGMRDFAIGCNMDGWAFFALAHGFTYSNSLWDEVNAYMGDQCVNIYPGAANRTISTRNAEAIRESVRRWRETKAEQLKAQQEKEKEGQEKK
jgi:hypothetical protein